MSKQREHDKLYTRFEALVQEVYAPEEKVVVRGEGNLSARLIMVGEAPGEQETVQRRPFVGKAGKNLMEFLEVLEWEREDIYITNVVKFRPYKVHPAKGTLSNRTPRADEIALCYHLLLAEIDLVGPKVVVTLGNTALKTLRDDRAVTIGDVHGRPLDMGAWVLFPLYHPASIIYNRALKATYANDIAALKTYLERVAP